MTNINISIGADIAILLILDIGKICVSKPIFFKLDVYLVPLSMIMPVRCTLKLRCKTNSKYVCNDNENYGICNICSLI